MAPMPSPLAAVLHRVGIVRQLRALWRHDIAANSARTAERLTSAVAAQRALRQELGALQRDQSQRRAATDAAVRELTARMAELADACRRLEGRTDALEQALAGNRRLAARLQALRRAASDGSVQRHVAAAIAAAPLLDDPAPMLVIERIFPDDIFETFVAALPPASAFAVKDRTKADYRTHQPRAAVSDLTEEAWSFLDGHLIPQTMVPAIIDRFASFIPSYYRDLLGPAAGEEVAALPLEATEARLMLRRPGYHLEPHMDPKRVLLTALIYFARPGDSPAHGTSFYRVDGRVVRDHATTFYPASAGHRCDPVRTVPFRPNTAAVFLNSAAHGADLPPDLPKTYERYALQFYVGPPIDALRSVLRRLPDDEKQRWRQLLD
jgi:hypothetical protein